MSSRQRASVVVTNRDYGRFVGEAVESALTQGDVEVVVVDDGSTDDSLEVLATFDGAITVVRGAGEGQAAAMNLGFARSSGDPVVFLDADDRLSAGAIDRALEVLADPAVARVHAPLRRVNVHGAPIGGTVPPVIWALPHGDLRRAVLRHPDDLAWQPTSGNVYRRSALDAVLPLPEAEYRISADHLLNAGTALVGRVERVFEIGGDYRVHGANADAREAFDLDRVQGIVRRSSVTHQRIGELSASLGFGDVRPTPPTSVSFSGNRIVSMRLRPAEHPLAGDSLGAAWRSGCRAALRRPDLGIRRRIGAIGFLTTLVLAPRQAVPSLAYRFLTGATDAPARPSAGAA